MGIKFLLNTGWMKSLISKAITIWVNKRGGLKATFGINGLEIEDNEEGVTLHLDASVSMTKEEFEKLIKNLI